MKYRCHYSPCQKYGLFVIFIRISILWILWFKQKHGYNYWKDNLVKPCECDWSSDGFIQCWPWIRIWIQDYIIKRQFLVKRLQIDAFVKKLLAGYCKKASMKLASVQIIDYYCVWNTKKIFKTISHFHLIIFYYILQDCIYKINF